MGNCLVTKLKSNIADDTLLKLGTFRIKVTVPTGSDREAGYMYLYPDTVPFTIKVVESDRYIENWGTPETHYRELDTSVNSGSFCLKEGTTTLEISNKYNITGWSASNKYAFHLGGRGTIVEIKTDEVNYAEHFVGIDMWIDGLRHYIGKLSELGNTSIEQIAGKDGLLSGNLSDLDSNNIKKLGFFDCPIVGNLDSFLTAQSTKGRTDTISYNISNCPNITGSNSVELYPINTVTLNGDGTWTVSGS